MSATCTSIDTKKGREIMRGEVKENLVNPLMRMSGTRTMGGGRKMDEIKGGRGVHKGVSGNRKEKPDPSLSLMNPPQSGVHREKIVKKRSVRRCWGLGDVFANHRIAAGKDRG